ncbi:TPA: phage tail protein, partial [Salmonella enterica subsp. diarizonae serovar 61:r:z53]
MAQSVITSAFEHLKAQEAAGGNRIIIDQFVFANIPGLNVTDTPQESEPLPPDAQIVHRQAVDRNGVVNENTVAYSVTLPESVGDFTFNWLGLVSSATNTLCMAVYLHPQEKIKTADGKQGNTLIYSEIMEYAGASAATGITTPVSTWQIDFTARLHGMDEATRKAALDIYGPGLFFNDAFKLTAQATGQATFAPGIAYLRGLRVELGVPGTLTYSTGISQTVYIDAALTGTLTGENKATFSLTSQKSADYIDSLGFAHYVEPVATISASGEITDIRKTRKPLNDRLDGEYLTRDGNLKEIAHKGEQAQSDAREHMGLGNSATLNVGTTQGTVAAGNDSRITGAMQKDQNGEDIPDKPKFIENLGLKETV